EWRPHAVHHRRGHRAAVGAVDAVAPGAAARARLRTWLVGTERHPPVDRAARMASAVRTGLAHLEVAGVTPRCDAASGGTRGRVRPRTSEASVRAPGRLPADRSRWSIRRT